VSAGVAYLAGTPGVAPEPPALPERSFLLGTITVPQFGGGSPSVVLNTARFVAAGARLPVTLAERAALTPYTGMEIEIIEQPGVYQRWSGDNWYVITPARIHGTDATFPPIIKTAFTSFTTGAFGDFTITLPTAYQNALTSAMVQEASPIANNDYGVIIKVRMDQSDKTKIVGRCYRGNDAKFVGSINVTYMAVGY
jgi:hypothetical protein